MKFKTFFAFVFGVGLGAAGTYYYFQRRYLEDITNRMEEEHKMQLEYEGLNAQKTYSETDKTPEVVIEPVEDEDSAEVIIRNGVLTESEEKADIFDYTKLSAGKTKNEKPVEKSHDPVDGVEEKIDFKMRKVTVTEFEELCYSYELQELTLYQDGYVTDYKDEVVYKFKEMYPDASLSDQDETGHIYIAADYKMTVFDVTVVAGSYKDIYPEEETGVN